MLPPAPIAESNVELVGRRSPSSFVPVHVVVLVLVHVLGCGPSAPPTDGGGPLDAGVDAAPQPFPGLGRRCTPDSIDNCGFHGETYFELSSPECDRRWCMVFELDAHPENLRSAGCPLDASRPECLTAEDASTCLDDETVVLPDGEPAPDSAERAFCTCPCVPDPRHADEPVCACGEGFSCSTYGVCLPERLDPAFCDRDDDPHCPGRCDVAAQRCR